MGGNLPRMSGFGHINTNVKKRAVKLDFGIQQYVIKSSLPLNYLNMYIAQIVSKVIERS